MIASGGRASLDPRLGTIRPSAFVDYIPGAALRIDFKDEVRTFLRRYGIEWDERYVWD